METGGMKAGECGSWPTAVYRTRTWTSRASQVWPPWCESPVRGLLGGSVKKEGGPSLFLLWGTERLEGCLCWGWRSPSPPVSSSSGCWLWCPLPQASGKAGPPLPPTSSSSLSHPEGYWVRKVFRVGWKLFCRHGVPNIPGLVAAGIRVSWGVERPCFC